MEPVQRLASRVPTRQAWSLVEEFKNFAFKGNIIDLAVVVIIGAACGKLIDSLVKYVLMPLIRVLVPGQQGYLEWKFVLNGKEMRPCRAGSPVLPALIAGDNLPRGGDDQRVRLGAILGVILFDGAYTTATEVLGKTVRLHRV